MCGYDTRRHIFQHRSHLRTISVIFFLLLPLALYGTVGMYALFVNFVARPRRGTSRRRGSAARARVARRRGAAATRATSAP